MTSDQPTQTAAVSDQAIMKAVRDTLLYVSHWFDDDVRAQLVDAANAGGYEGDALAWCCPVCQEVRCDPDCPLAVVRGSCEDDAS